VGQNIIIFYLKLASLMPRVPNLQVASKIRKHAPVTLSPSSQKLKDRIAKYG